MNNQWLGNVRITFFRDLSVLLRRYVFWLLLSAWMLISAVLFFYYLEHFLNIQPSLRAKDFRYGVTDLVISPYLKTQGLVSIIFMASLCSRLFYLECFASFSVLYRSLNHSTLGLLTAKLSYIFMLSLLASLILLLPVLGSGLFFAYNVSRVLLTGFSLFLLLFLVGGLAMFLSLIFMRSISVVLVSVLLIGLSELAVKLVTNPVWLSSVISFFSPISHINRIATGTVNLSDLTFFLSSFVLLCCLSIRRYNNTYFTT